MEEVNISGLTEKQLKWSYWFFKNKTNLIRALKIFLIALDVLLWGYTLYGVVWYFGVNYPDQVKMENLLTANYIDYASIHRGTAAQDLALSPIQVLDAGKGKYDFVVEAQNPNPQWAFKKLTYHFAVDGVALSSRDTFFLPSEQKFIYQLAFKSALRPRNVELVIDQEQMQRVIVQQYEAMFSERVAFDIQDVKTFGATASEVSQKLQVSKTNFAVTNKSAYNYREVGFYIVLRGAGEKVVAINYILLNDLYAGEKRDVEVNWYQGLPAARAVEVIPEVNILDARVYREPGK